VGRVGTGFTNDLLLDLKRKIGEKGQSIPTVHMAPGKIRDLRLARWFKPSFVVEVFLRGVSDTGVLRQPSLKAIRLDKKLKDLRDGDRS
jgi:bifunctional non-homologous end joining protein LigD